jgi:hypothetical protein
MRRAISARRNPIRTGNMTQPLGAEIARSLLVVA